MSIYTFESFSTPDDDANNAAVKAVSSQELDLVGIALRGRKKVIDKITKRLALHA